MPSVITVTSADVAMISEAMAAAEPIAPASSSCRIEIAASVVFGEYRNTTAEIVVIALTKK
jgi:hypothetical protein